MPDLGTKDPALREGGVSNGRRLCQHLAAALPRRPSWSYAFVRGCQRPSRIRGLGLRRWRQRPGLPISWTRSFASAWMCCLHALFRLLISSPFNNRNLKSRNIISLSPPLALDNECTYSFASSGICQQCSYFQIYWALAVGGGGGIWG